MTKIIGLTGPVAAGKNEVARMFRRRRAVVIDVDKLAHTLYKPQTEVWRKLVKRFGSEILQKGGKVARKKLAKIVFGSRTELKALNQIVHPPLFDLVIREIAAAKHNGAKLIIINAAILKKIGLDKLVNEIWAVTANEKLRLKRLIKNGMDENHADHIIKAQGSAKKFSVGARVVLENNSTLAALKNSFLKYFPKI